MAEAQGQAVEQPALGALAPHEAVAHLTAAFEQAEREEAAPARDEKGKFVPKQAEAKAEPDKPAEAPAEAEAEAPAPAEEQPEIQPEPRRFKLKYKGEELEKDETEVIALAQQGFDYSAKTMALAKERTELEAKVKADTEAALKKYEADLEVHKQAILKLADPEALNADLNKLSLEDPARAQQLFFKRLQIQQSFQAVAAEQQRIAQQRDMEAQASKQKSVSEALETIQREVPGWSNELYGKLLKTATEVGFSQAEANAITDARQIKLLNEARQWREYVAAKPKTVEKRVAAVPKVQKPGQAGSPDSKADKTQVSMARLEKSGSRKDAQDYVLALMEAGKL